MKCQRCQEEIAQGEDYNYRGQLLCEDCYLGALQQPKTCDVMAVHSAKTHRALAGQTGTDGLTELQKELYDYVQEQGKATKAQLAEKFNLPEWELEKQFAVLRHCELLKARKEDNQIYLVPFDAE